MILVLKTPPWSLSSTPSGETPLWPSERFKPMASNQKEAYNRAKAKYEEAKRNGVKGRDLDDLKAAMDAAEARLLSAAGVDSVDKAS